VRDIREIYSIMAYPCVVDRALLTQAIKSLPPVGTWRDQPGLNIWSVLNKKPNLVFALIMKSTLVETLKHE
jgi:hypothetical protein